MYNTSNYITIYVTLANNLAFLICLHYRMESKEKCEQIIQMFNGSKALPGAKDPLLVKFADGGNKKKSLFKSTIWRETGEVCAFIISLLNYVKLLNRT